MALESGAPKTSSVIFLAFFAVSLMLFVCHSKSQQMHLCGISLENNSNCIGEEGRNTVRNVRCVEAAGFKLGVNEKRYSVFQETVRITEYCTDLTCLTLNSLFPCFQ